jgi:hypothetical protein
MVAATMTVKLQLLGMNNVPLAVGTGPTFDRAQAKLNRAVKRHFPTLFQLDLNPMAQAIRSDNDCPHVTVTSTTETFRLRRVNRSF